MYRTLPLTRMNPEDTLYARPNSKSGQSSGSRTSSHAFTYSHAPSSQHRSGTPNGPRALARRLERDKGRVSRDFGVLAEHGIIECETHGRAKRPKLAQEHLVVEPLV